MIEHEKKDNTKGQVFNIQHYSIHDGPGIRTTVFINGCPLRCVWCQNPESQSITPKIFFSADKCAGCGKCVGVCESKAIGLVNGKAITNRHFCIGCGKCIQVCPNEARNLMGKEMTAGEVFADVYADRVFYKNSGGGITISGGDPLAQHDFTLSILKLCKEANLHTTMDTTGYAKWEVLKKLLNYTDMVLYDFKHMNPEKHNNYTGVSNELILDNARMIIKKFPAIVFVARIPVIPGYNDDKENLDRVAKFIAEELDPSIKVHLLPYHKLGNKKYELLEEISKVLEIEPPSDEHMQGLCTIFQNVGLQCVIGG